MGELVAIKKLLLKNSRTNFNQKSDGIEQRILNSTKNNNTLNSIYKPKK